MNLTASIEFSTRDEMYDTQKPLPDGTRVYAVSPWWGPKIDFSIHHLLIGLCGFSVLLSWHWCADVFFDEVK